MSTNGGNEYCGYAIQSATRQLQWSPSQEDIKAIFIAGNEPFSQGPVNFKESIIKAKQHGIVVNTIFAGSYDQGIASGWNQGAQLARGNYMSIDYNRKIVHIEASQDKAISQLNQQLNRTYIPYGLKGKIGLARQQEQDMVNNKISSSLLAKRAKVKVSAFYDNSQWDLIDAVDSGKADLGDTNSLPKNMQSMSNTERKHYLSNKKKERQEIKEKITQLSKERDAYVAEQRKQVKTNTIDQALIGAIRRQGKNKGFQFRRSIFNRKL